jgi:hypothetical protein
LAFALSPSSTRRRMASERPGASSCLPAQESTFARNSSESRIVLAGSRPVAGRPPLFGFGNTALDFDMVLVLPQKQAEGKRQLPPRL